jgi:hypothetical protein
MEDLCKMLKLKEEQLTLNSNSTISVDLISRKLLSKCSKSENIIARNL